VTSSFCHSVLCTLYSSLSHLLPQFLTPIISPPPLRPATSAPVSQQPFGMPTMSVMDPDFDFFDFDSDLEAQAHA
jgi:hypothetical protein